MIFPLASVSGPRPAQPPIQPADGPFLGVNRGRSVTLAIPPTCAEVKND
jgi:hypothetical protein